jgi:hypothetical protein
MIPFDDLKKPIRDLILWASVLNFIALKESKLRDDDSIGMTSIGLVKFFEKFLDTIEKDYIRQELNKLLDCGYFETVNLYFKPSTLTWKLYDQYKTEADAFILNGEGLKN